MDGVELHQHGYLFLLDNERDVERFRAARARQHTRGGPARGLSVDEALAIVPQLDPEGLVAATFCELDGHVTPEEVVQWYARGLDVRQGCEVTGIDVEGGRVSAVETTKGRIATETVVCCAGAWSNEIGAMAGMDIPVRGEAHWMHFTPSDGGLPERLPLTVDFSSGFYFHREGPGLAFGGREQSLEDMAVPAARRLPVLAELPVQSSWWGYYEVSPDYNAIVGEAAGPSRFLYATGFSGHGFQQAPAVGEHIAELVVGREPTLDLSPFSLERFERNEARPEAFVI
jgi:sarcosine oxidase subunit beta